MSAERGISIRAAAANVGQEYISLKGWPVRVVKIDKMKDAHGRRVEVTNLLTGDQVRIYEDQLLWPYRKELITKEAITMAKAEKGSKKADGVRGGERGARRDGETVVVFRAMKGRVLEAKLKDGALVYDGKKYASIKAVAEAMKGGSISGSGRSFFGLRTEPNITLGKEVFKALKAAAEAAREEEDDEDDEPTKKKASAEPAKMATRGRGRR